MIDKEPFKKNLGYRNIKWEGWNYSENLKIH